MIYENAKVDDILPKIREILKEEEYVREKKNHYGTTTKVPALRKGLLLKGITGCGKTHTLYAIRSGLKSISDCTPVHNWVKLLFELKKDNFAKVNQTINEITASDFIFIDDIGAENSSTGWSDEMLYLIINEAYVNEKRIFITTNLNDQEFIEKYGNRIASRIMEEMCIPINMPKENWRNKK